MHRLGETIGGLYELLRLAAQSRFRMRNPYWRWRYETAFGTNPDHRPGRAARFRAVLDYGRWIHRMKRRMKQ